MEKLAINGGAPVRETVISYARQWVDEEDVAAAAQTMRGDYLTSGPKVAELERALCEFTGAKYAVAVSSGTAALHCACLAAGIGAGDEVITSPLTFAASANCALYCGARPVFTDVDPETYTIDPAGVEARVTSRTKALVAVDYTGQAVKVRELGEICRRRGLVFIEDAAHSFATSYDGSMVGSLADMTCFSFHPVKTITCGEGGAVLTDSEAFYRKLVLLRSHGITHGEDRVQWEPEGPWYYEQVALGYNYRLTDIQSALLLSQMRKIQAFKARRREIAARYDAAFGGNPALFLQKTIPESDTCRHLYVLQLVLDRLACTRREFFDALCAEGVRCQVHYIPVYWFPYYRNLGYRRGLCPRAEAVYERIMSLPLYPRMTDWDVDSVIDAVNKVVRHYIVEQEKEETPCHF